MKTLVNALQLNFGQFGPSVAIDGPDCRLTYAELDELTRRVALSLRARLDDQRLKSKPVAILMPRSVELYVAEISVLRAGGFFLPIDPAQPAERIEFLLSDSQASLVLVREADACTLPSSAMTEFSIDVNQLKQDRDNDWQSKDIAEDFDVEVCETDLAYMIYTSGSSGQPKGAAIPHRAIWNFCHWWSEESWTTSGERTLQMLSVGFDASLEEIFPTLLTGGTLVPVQPEALNSMASFLDFVDQQQLNNLHLPTAFWHTLSASFEMHVSLKLPASVRTVVFGGEKTDPIQVESWFSRVGTDVRLINAYGPTEATVAASYAVLQPGDPPSIGKPLRGVNYCVVGEDGQLVETGQPGELYIGGAGLATGYWRREKLTAEKFVDSPLASDQTCYRTGDLVRLGSHGNYEFIGRIDSQVKLRGYRIELDEISSNLGSHPQISQAHVVVRQLSNTSGAQHLVGYVVAKSDQALSETELKDFLQARLPAYMVPTRIIEMESFPVNAGGKLALDLFPNPALNVVSDPDLDDDSQLLTPTERKLGKIWAQVLGTGLLDRESNFFQIGGDSLSAMRLVLLLESEFPGPVVPVAALIPNPTIRLMADYIDRRQSDSPVAVSKNWPVLTRFGASDGLISVVCLHAAGGGGVFYRQLHEGYRKTKSTAVLESAILYQSGLVVCERQSVAELARDYVDCLIDAGCEKELTLVGYSFGCLLAFEMTRLLKQQGFVVDRVINIDSPNPQTMKPRYRFSRFLWRFRLPRTMRDRLGDFKAIMQRKRQTTEVEKLVEAKLPPSVELRPLALELEFGRLAKKYAPERCDVSMHLICGAEPEAMYDIPQDYGWTDCVSELTLVQIPGGHNSIFNQPYLQRLIEAFQEALAE